ncbi:MAG: DpnII family type II restriction endonuclease [Treponema sp.]
MLTKPFIKWVGGKSQLLEKIREKYPSKIEKYCEPFVGGGAVLFDVLGKFQPKAVLINDINKELINTYTQIRNNCSEMISQLSVMQIIYQNHTTEENKKFFYEKRNRYNELKVNENEAENLEKAVLFIFLNKTCFNGLYRVNSKGLFNVPFNNAKNPFLCDNENLKNCSALLQNVEMKVGDYKECKSFIDDKTFVYIDPPYRPLTKTATFTSYSENSFSDKEQIELRNFITEISNKGANVLASNSDPKNINENDEFFDELYSNFEIERVSASRIINSNAKKRGSINELLISNIPSVVKELKMEKNFDLFISQLSETNATLDYFTDFEKAISNTNKIAIKLNQLNYLIGKQNLRKAIKELYEENPKVFEVLDILLAVRTKDKKKTLNSNGEFVLLESYFTSLQGVIDYIEQTGLAEIFKNKNVSNLVDYVFGVEVGLDTNARKNPGGDNMVKAIALKFKSVAIPFLTEVNSTEFEEIRSLGQDLKRFDFVIQTKKKTYLIETNFYNAGGSKLNEVARAYTDIAQKINQYKKFEFVWITDGQGWLSAKNKLGEAYSLIPSIYNLANLDEFLSRVKSEL